MKVYILSISLFCLQSLFGQKCENYDKTLFHMLPANYPDTINCTDSLGQKQGHWIEYEIKYNSSDIPDELEKGHYVPRFYYGSYLNDKRIGKWESIFNVHLISVFRVDSFYYSIDTNLMITEFFGYNTLTYYNTDSSIMSYEWKELREKYPIKILCNKKGQNDLAKQCTLTYRDKIVKYFPFGLIHYEMDRIPYNYIREINDIDDQLKENESLR